MRNLKKILALVLALVMSLSLMAVASADDELNLGDVSETYAESVDVLTGLKVFMGNKGEFLPKDNITRAEVAAIIYRIVTGDVADAQKGIYADYNKFSDVTSDAWYAGYVNYCANAEYVKGVGYDANGKAMFKPQQNVTGYEALAMILRAIGYDRNNEFTGPSWQIQTAATARNRGILKNIAEGTLGGAATREAVAEILCQTILVPVADYSLAFGYRTTDANGKDNETLAYKTFKMEKVEGVVLANEYAALDADTPLPAGQTKLELRDDTTKTMDVASDLDAIGESRYVYVRPLAGTTRFELVCSKLYGEENNNVYDNEGAAVSTVSGSTGSEAGITSIDGAEHFVNFSQNDEYETKIRIKYVMQVRMSEYDAKVMYALNGNADNSMLKDLVDDTKNNVTSLNDKDYRYIKYEKDISNKWSQLITSNATHTYEYTKVIPAFTKLTDTDWANLQSIFANADYVSSPIVGEVYVGTNSTSTFDLLPILTGTGLTGTRDISDYITWEKFVADYLNVKENKTQVTSNGLGQHLKIVDNNQDGVAEYVLQTKYTVAIMAANGTSLDVSGVQLVDSKIRDNINSVPSATTPFFSTEGLAAGDVVVYALIDGKIHATKAEGETVKINTVNRAATTATATGEDGKTWSESDVHTHSNGLHSGVIGMVGNTTYNIYFDLYGNLAAYTEGTNGGLVLITNGWYNNTISGPEYAIQAYVDGALQTVTVGSTGSLFVGPHSSNNISNNTWGCLKTGFGTTDTNGFGNINAEDKGHANRGSGIHTIVANLDGNVLTPVDKTYLYSQQLRMLDMQANVIPGRDNASTSWATPYKTNYGVNNTAYQAPGAEADDRTPNANTSLYEVRALSNTVYYTVYRGIGSDSMTGRDNVVVRSYTGYNNVPAIDSTYIEDVYAVGARATTATGHTYYAAQVVVIELNSKYENSRRDSAQVFIPEFSEVTNSIGIENVTMIGENGEITTVQVDMTRSNTSDQYDTAGETGRADRRPGLYYMDPSDTNPNVYVVERMSPEEVRANNYAVGYSRESYAVLGNNFAQVETLYRPESTLFTADKYVTDFGSNENAAKYDLAQATRPGNVSNYNWSSNAVTTENTYTYGGTAATLVKAAPAVVLNQGAAVNAGETVNGLNERWDGLDEIPEADGNVRYPYVRASFPYGNRNEVLVRYDAAGNVIYAVSFNEGTSAQTVWWNCLPAKNYSVKELIKFWGYTVNDTTNYLVIAASQANGAQPIVDLSALGASVMSHKVFRQNLTNPSQWELLSQVEEANEKPNPAIDQHYRLEITLNDGTTLIYYLTKKAANNTADLVDGNGNGVKPNVTSTTIDGIPTGWTIEEYLNNFTASDNGMLKWTLTTGGGTVYNITRDRNGKYDGDWNKISQNKVNAAEIAIITVQVVNENGDNTALYNNGAAGNVAKAQAAAKAALTAAIRTKLSAQGITETADQDKAMATGELAAYINAMNAKIESARTLAALATVLGVAEDKISVDGTTGEVTITNGVTNLPTVDEINKAPDTIITETATEMKPYATLPEAVDGVITLEKDADLTARYVADGETVTIDLNGHNLTGGTTDVLRVINGGNLTITGTGTISTKNADNTAIWLMSGGGTLTVGENVTISAPNDNESEGYGIGVYASGSIPATVNLNGKILGGNGLTVNGDISGGVTVNVGSTANITVDDTGLYLAGAAVTNIKGATISGGINGIEIRAGELNVNGGSINSRATSYSAPVVNGNGTTTSGVAIGVSPHNTEAGKSIAVTVAGGAVLSGDATEGGPKQIALVNTGDITDANTRSVVVTGCPAITANKCVNATSQVFTIDGGQVTPPTPAAPPAGDGGGKDQG